MRPAQSQACYLVELESGKMHLMNVLGDRDALEEAGRGGKPVKAVHPISYENAQAFKAAERTARPTESDATLLASAPEVVEAIGLVASELEKMKGHQGELSQKLEETRLMLRLTLEAAQLANDPTPTPDEYPMFSGHFGLTMSSTPDDWDKAIAKFRKSG